MFQLPISSSVPGSPSGPLEKISMVPVEEVEELPSTERGEGGFGSTGTESHNVESGSDENSSKRIKLGKNNRDHFIPIYL